MIIGDGAYARLDVFPSMLSPVTTRQTDPPLSRISCILGYRTNLSCSAENLRNKNIGTRRLRARVVDTLL